ncbi:MAG: hypothetical protein K5868_09810 [Lachnospiraceae bacterium]|nr:hypothetical protein [Lachnospiraceae bacterium]
MLDDKLHDTVDEDKLITDDVIINLKPLVFRTIEDVEIADFIHLQCQKVLQLAKEKNCSKEVASAVNLETFDVLSPVYGDSRSVNIDYLISQMKGTDYAFLVMHNHPSGFYFSRRDLKTFIDAENMTILIVLGNDGSIYIIEKKRQLLLGEVLSARKTLVDWKYNVIDYKTVIEQLGEFGIVYSEM